MASIYFGIGDAASNTPAHFLEADAPQIPNQLISSPIFKIDDYVTIINLIKMQLKEQMNIINAHAEGD